MKRVVLPSVLILLCSLSARAQQPSAPAIPPGEARIQSLEEQVRTLAEQVALLRAELQTMHQTQVPAAPAANQLLLAATHVEPGMVAAAPANAASPSAQPPAVSEPVAPAPAQVA